MELSFECMSLSSNLSSFQAGFVAKIRSPVTFAKGRQLWQNPCLETWRSDDVTSASWTLPGEAPSWAEEGTGNNGKSKCYCISWSLELPLSFRPKTLTDLNWGRRRKLMIMSSSDCNFEFFISFSSFSLLLSFHNYSESERDFFERCSCALQVYPFYDSF